MSRPKHLTLKDPGNGSHAIHCSVCRVSLVPDLPMDETWFLTVLSNFTFEHSHDWVGGDDGAQNQ